MYVLIRVRVSLLAVNKWAIIGLCVKWNSHNTHPGITRKVGAQFVKSRITRVICAKIRYVVFRTEVPGPAGALKWGAGARAPRALLFTEVPGPKSEVPGLGPGGPRPTLTPAVSDPCAPTISKFTIIQQQEHQQRYNDNDTTILITIEVHATKSDYDNYT